MTTIETRPMYDAICKTCGIDLKVPFQPDGVRPVYCREHNPNKKPPKEQPKLNLLQDTDGTVLVKFFFQSPDGIPIDIPERKDVVMFKTDDRGRRQDTGTLVINREGVNAEFLRTGLANADGHQWKLVNVCKWEQPITSEEMRRKLGCSTQWVVQLAYRNAPKPEDVWYLPRKVLNAVRELAGLYTWHAYVWQNDMGPATINFTSPTNEDPQGFLIVRDGNVTLEKVEQPKAAKGTSDQQPTA